MTNSKNNLVEEWKCITCSSTKKEGFKNLCLKCYQKKWRDSPSGKKSKRKTYYKYNDKVRSNSKKRYYTKKKEILTKRNERAKVDSFFDMKRKMRLKHNNFVRYNYKEANCNDCGELKPIKEIQIHHINWKSNPEKYILLCKKCHYKVHGKVYYE